MGVSSEVAPSQAGRASSATTQGLKPLMLPPLSRGLLPRSRASIHEANSRMGVAPAASLVQHSAPTQLTRRELEFRLSSEPLAGGYCEMLIANGDEGSALRKMYLDDYAEAIKFLEFLRQDFPQSFKTLVFDQGVSDPSVAVDIHAGTFMVYGKSRLQDARNAASRLSKWWSSEGPGGANGDPIASITSLQFRCYLVHVTQSAREYQARRGQNCADTAARKQRIDIKVFALLIGARLWLAVFSDPLVIKVTPAQPTSQRVVTKSAVMPLAFQLHLEWLAANHPSQFIRIAAATMALCGILVLRCIEMQRCRLLNRVESTEADPNEPLLVRCDAGKAATRATMFPFEMATYPEGYAGDARKWLAELSALSYGQAAILPDFVTEGRSGSILHATEWRVGTPLPASKWPAVCTDLFSIAPLL